MSNNKHKDTNPNGYKQNNHKKKKYNSNVNNKSINKSNIESNKLKEERFNKEEKIDIPASETTSNLEKKELDRVFGQDFNVKGKDKSMKKNVIIHIFLIVLSIVAVVFLGVNICNKDTSALVLISNLLLTLFTVLFTVICITSTKKNKSTILVSGLLLFVYFTIELSNSFNFLNINGKVVEDFSGKSLTYVMKWAEANNVTVNQDYEYSDMVDEYKIISQDKEYGTRLKNSGEITVSVSEGPNPSKEVIVPSMITWDSERVLEFVKENYLSNVIVEFVESDKAQDTVIEQNTSGSLKRDDELKLTFSYGEELGYEEVSLIDFTGKSKFEVEFYMKQHQLKYEFDNDFSDKQKRGLVIKQSIKPGKKVKINDETVKVTISKGPKIKVPDFKGMSMTEVTEWAIKNKVKLEFSDKYDDSIKENNVISVNFEKGKVIEQGTVLKVVLSRGKLTMPKFKSFNEFREWAEKYEIKYEEKHEFNDDIAIGEVISFSYKKGDTIKNGDTIVVKISDGKKKEVPNLKGLTKSEAISRLEKADLKYNFVYSSSNDVEKDKVISQSLSAGSEVSSGTTVTVTLSSGKKETSNNKNSGSSSSSNGRPSNSGGSSGSSNSGSGSSSSESPAPVCTPCTITGLRTVYHNNSGSYDGTAAGLRSHISSQCPGIKVNIVPDRTSGMTPGSPVGGFTGGDTNSCSTVTITIAQ